MQSISIGNPGATGICESHTFLSNVKYTHWETRRKSTFLNKHTKVHV